MNKKAFTLIEMMIVIAIISALLMASMPIYNKMIFKSRADEAKATIHAIALAQERYFQEIGEYYPPIATGEVTNENVIGDNLKVDLSKSNNFNYFITTDDSNNSLDGNYTIKAMLRSDDWSICTTTTLTSKCKMSGSANIESWVSNYSNTDRANENKHYLEFRYPTKIDDDYSEGGISYEHLYE